MEITALNPYDYNIYDVEAALAGAYLEVTGEKGSTVVSVTVYIQKEEMVH